MEGVEINLKKKLIEWMYVTVALHFLSRVKDNVYTIRRTEANAIEKVLSDVTWLNDVSSNSCIYIFFFFFFFFFVKVPDTNSNETIMRRWIDIYLS